MDIFWVFSLFIIAGTWISQSLKQENRTFNRNKKVEVEVEVESWSWKLKCLKYWASRGFGLKTSLTNEDSLLP